MVWPLRHSYWWAPRRALMTVGFGLVVMGILGFFFDWETTANVVYINAAKSIVCIVTGLALLLVGEVWSAGWKRKVAAFLVLASLGLGILGIVAGASGSQNLGFTHVNRPWEGTIWLGLAAWTATTLWWPRRMFDYEWATGTSSGIRSTG